MKIKTIVHIIKKIIKLYNPQITPIKHEDDDKFYKVWCIEDNNLKYILKKASVSEIEFYKNVTSDFVAKFYGTVNFYNKDYILIEYIDGTNLMKGCKENVIKVLDALIFLQKKYWDSNKEIGISFDENYQKVLSRGKYLNDELLEKTYKLFSEFYIKCPKTLCHDDLLPFNVIVNNKKGVFIDWEYYGILPYPLSICRLLTHYKDDENYLFYLKEEDKEFAFKYYYDNFIKEFDITYDEYTMNVDYFMFYEFTEWVFVYNKYNVKKDDRFNYYYSNAISLGKKIIFEGEKND